MCCTNAPCCVVCVCCVATPSLSPSILLLSERALGRDKSPGMFRDYLVCGLYLGVLCSLHIYHVSMLSRLYDNELLEKKARNSMIKPGEIYPLLPLTKGQDPGSSPL